MLKSLYEKSMKKYFWQMLGLCIFSFALGGIVNYSIFNVGNLYASSYFMKVQDSELKNSASALQSISVNNFKLTTTTSNLETISIGFVGDIIPGLNTSPDMFDGVSSYTNKPDIMIGNLEGAITKNQYNKCKPNSQKCFAFNGDDNFLELLSMASFDALNTSNNHFNDYGKYGMEETLKKIQELGIVPIGEKDRITYINKNNLKIGMVGFSTSWWAEDINNDENVNRIIKEAKNNSDIVIVVFHGGGEGEKYSHTPNQTEWYLGENRGDVRAFAHRAIDAGADIVFGSGPHVLRGIERYNNKLIAYSLGNFASASERLMSTGSLKTSAMIEVILKSDGSFVSGKVYPMELNDSLHPYPDPNNTAISYMNDLSKNDFGDQGVLIDNSGEIIFQ